MDLVSSEGAVSVGGSLWMPRNGHRGAATVAGQWGQRP